MSDPFDLQRFVTAQETVFDTVLKELKAARKQTHWMWFIFPQLSTARVRCPARSRSDDHRHARGAGLACRPSANG
jgi:uncharacterized protein (DUF1810 family)